MTRLHRLSPVVVSITAAALALALLAAGAQSGPAGDRPAAAKVWLVTSKADSGPGTLRQALQAAAASDTIRFSPAVFPPTSPVTIAPASPLPAIVRNDLTIDASDAGVVLDGSAAGGKVPGLYIQASGVTVRGLQIVGFDGCGVEIRGPSNTIGGDPARGDAPTGQGNRLSGNGHSGVCIFDGGNSNTIRGNLIGVDVAGARSWGTQGDGVHIVGGHHNLVEDNVISSQGGSGVRLCCSGETAYNVVRNNKIGTGKDGETPIPCHDKGVAIADGAHHNTIGPGNVIANTAGSHGVAVAGGLSPGNTVLGNSISQNEGSGILLWNENMDLVPPPAITTFDLAAGLVSGVGCPNCLIQIYSDEDNEGRVFEGQVTAGATGRFSFRKGGPLAGPHLTATATDAEGTTSIFSVPTAGSRSVPLQRGNASAYARLATLPASQLADNRLAFYVQAQDWVDIGMADAVVLDRMGVKRARGQMNDPDSYLVNWATDELEIHDNFNQMITGLDARGIRMIYNLLFWDKAWYRRTGSISVPRFQNEGDVRRYHDFVRLMVRTFGDRVDYWELWNEPSFAGSYQWILVDDYIDLIKTTIPVIRAEDPGAKIVVGSYHGWEEESYRDYFFRVLESDVMPLADIVSWHPFLVHLESAECGGELFDRYPRILAEIKSIARAHGFRGEFSADELRFPTWTPSATGSCHVFDRTAGKYYAREIVRHLGEDVSAGIIMNGDTQIRVVEHLGTLMAGAEPITLSLSLSPPTDVVSYAFALPGGDRLAALWRRAGIGDDDQQAAISVTLRLPGAAGESAYAIDVLNGVQQRLVTSSRGDDLVVTGLVVRDYPLLIRLAPRRELYLPAVER